MTASYESDFDAALNRGRVYGSAEQLRATPEGTPITDAQAGTGSADSTTRPNAGGDAERRRG
ncbi:hypothetical protein ACFVX3_32705 [Rhodococcus erythropolis]